MAVPELQEIYFSKMTSFFQIYITTFTRPGKAFEALRNHPRSLQLAWMYLLIPIIGYTFMYSFF